MLSFLIGALRAIVEMLGLCLIGQAALYVLVGQSRQKNPIYQLFALITGGPRRFVGYFLPKTMSPPAVAATTFLVLLFLWLGLAFLRKFV